MRTRIQIDGWDGDTAHFSVRSFSSPSVWYAVWFRIDNGNVLCECMDASCRAKVGNLYRPADCCKHAALVIDRLNRLLDRPAPTLQDLAALVDDRFKGYLA